MNDSKKSNEARSPAAPAEGPDDILPPNADKASSSNGTATHKQRPGKDPG